MTTTKSLGQKDKFDKFYTNIDVAKKCLKIFESYKSMNLYDCIIEPSAGSGSFSSLINNCYAYDIAPEGDNITKADWLKLDKKQFSKFSNILVIGNPPYGVQNNLAVNFFNESAKFCNTIAFILPLSFKKRSIQDRLNLYFHLESETILNKNSFTLNGEAYSVPCVFQIWSKKDTERKKRKIRSETKLFKFVDKDNADFRIQRAGGNSGKASKNLDYSPNSNFFIKNTSDMTDDELINIINSTKFDEVEYNVGPHSLSKTSLINTLEEVIYKKQK